MYIAYRIGLYSQAPIVSVLEAVGDRYVNTEELCFV